MLVLWNITAREILRFWSTKMLHQMPATEAINEVCNY